MSTHKYLWNEGAQGLRDHLAMGKMVGDIPLLFHATRGSDPLLRERRCP